MFDHFVAKLLFDMGGVGTKSAVRVRSPDARHHHVRFLFVRIV
jgi:hypothetical protein